MFLLKKVFPSYCCILCGLPAGHARDLCAACLHELPILSHPCPRCAKPLSHAALECGDCLTTPPPFDFTLSLFAYKPPITHLILNLKFQEALVNAQVFGELLAEKIHSAYYKKNLPDVLIPVPLHPKRLRERGFNQALEIARPVAKKFSLPLNTSLCQRIKYTSAQARLNALARKKNLRHAFSILQSVQNLHIAILDDVITTGHTVTALSQALKKQGAKRIDIWCIARAF